MKRLLVSVRSATEALLALECGVDLIDVKEPRRGALGAAEASVWREVLDCVDGRVPVSCALGELNNSLARVPDVPCGMSFIKVGLAGALELSNWSERWGECLAARPQDCAAAAVVYADWQAAQAPAPAQVLETAVALGCSALLVDTFDKRAGDVFAHWPPKALAAFLAEASSAGLTTLLGGGLTWDALETALAMPTDYLAVRGLACGGNRNGGIDAASCARLVGRVHA